MPSALALLNRIDRNARRDRGPRLSPEETDLLRTVLELSESHAQAQALDADAEPSCKTERRPCNSSTNDR